MNSKRFAILALLPAIFSGCEQNNQNSAAKVKQPAVTREMLTNVYPATMPVDPRTTTLRSLYQGSGFAPYTSRKQWEERAQYIREQILISAGLWPLPRRCEMNPVIHGLVDRGDYTVEKVFFQSYPGFYVSGNLYRPKGKKGPFPAVLCPHGHWGEPQGRFYENSDKGVENEINGGFEKDPVAAKYPLQARSANMAKMGCVVFFYDMVGYADADQQRFGHRKTFLDADSDLRLISIFGLQTWDSIRAIDFVQSLPDVDKDRIACTGASGGGSQTFVLMNTDPRLKVAAPVCMISHHDHQGGCVCENNSLLRLGTDNVEFAATFAPKPFVHPTATGDWTKDYMEKGYPEIKATYALYDAEQNTQAVRFKAGHNYNLNNRETVYNFFNQHLGLNLPSPVKEQPFTAIAPKDLSVYDEAHPRPAGSVGQTLLKKYLVDEANAQLEALRPKDTASLAEYRRVLGSALRHMLFTSLPDSNQVQAESRGEVSTASFSAEKLLIGRKGEAARVPAVLFTPRNSSGAVTIIVHPAGKKSLINADGSPGAQVTKLLEDRQSVLAIDVFKTGESASPEKIVPSPEFVYGYNRTTLGNRAHDILTATAYLYGRRELRKISWVGLDKAGVWMLMARPLAGSAVSETFADAAGFDFNSVKDSSDENYQPGILRYGGLGPIAGLSAPYSLTVKNLEPSAAAWMKDAYKAANASGKLKVE